MRAVTVRLLGLVALATVLFSTAAWGTEQLTGCCSCGPSKCVTTSIYYCGDSRTHGSSCVFTIGGHCDDDRCIGGTQTATPSPNRTPTTTATKNATRTATKTHRATATVTAAASATATRTVSPGTGEMPTSTATVTLSPTATATATISPTTTATISCTPTETREPTHTASATATDTETATETATATDTGTATQTATATGTATGTATATITPSMPVAPTATGTATASATSAATGTHTPTETPTPTPLCPSTPRAGCRNPSPPNSWVLLLRDVNDRKDRFVWRWRGVNSGIDEFGDPTVSTDYAFCLYAGTAEARVMQARAPAGDICGTRPCWKKRDSRRFKYVDRDRTPDGIARIALRARPSKTRAHVVVAGRGPNLDMPLLPLEQPLRAQLVKSDGPECWEATFSAPPLKSNKRQFRDKND